MRARTDGDYNTTYNADLLKQHRSATPEEFDLHDIPWLHAFVLQVHIPAKEMKSHQIASDSALQRGHAPAGVVNDKIQIIQCGLAYADKHHFLPLGFVHSTNHNSEKLYCRNETFAMELVKRLDDIAEHSKTTRHAELEPRRSDLALYVEFHHESGSSVVCKLASVAEARLPEQVRNFWAVLWIRSSRSTSADPPSSDPSAGPLAAYAQALRAARAVGMRPSKEDSPEACRCRPCVSRSAVPRPS
jgi:hypothetical protein